ncbi:MAG TPA: alpha/beta hydrolase, partial [Candidatus Ozemobacteraceae bacterium]|nr:alpha/beta hydrolase [Candidatus Ozemobacteraceae bacterium]
VATCKQVVSGVSALRCPVLMITGTEDAIAGRSSAEAVKTAIPGVHAVEIAGGGHALVWTHAAFVADRITENFA